MSTEDNRLIRNFDYVCPVCLSPLPFYENAYCYTCGGVVKRSFAIPVLRDEIEDELL